MKKTKLLSLFSSIPMLSGLALPVITSCKNKEVTKYTVTIASTTGGTVEGPETKIVTSGTKWKDIKDEWEVKEDSEHLFDNWYYGSSVVTDNTVIKSNMTITAKFVLKRVVTIVCSEGGTVSGGTSKVVPDGTLWKTIKSTWTPKSNDGYMFDNWYINGVAVTDTTSIKSNVTITANFVEKCTITAVAGENGSISGPTSYDVPKGTTWGSIKSKWSTVPNTYYNFTGWYINDQQINDQTILNANTTVTAKFTIKTFTVNFVASTGGSISGITTTTVAAKTLWKDISNKPEAVESTNYEFDGWYIGSTKVTDNTAITSNVTITAKFTAIKITKTVDPCFYFVDNSGSYVEGFNLNDYYPGTNIYHFNNLPMGYINIEAYLGDLNSECFTVSTSNKKTTIVSYTVSGENTCVIDHKNQTITFTDYENFNSYDNTYGPMTGGCGGGENYYNNVTTITYNKNKSLVIDLSKYNIRTFCYTANNVTNGYMPWEFYRNVFGLWMGFSGVYDWDYNGSGIYEIVDGYRSTSLMYKKLAKSAASSNFYNSDYMEYTYNLLALTLDLRYGLVERQSRAHPGTTIKYLENGAYDLIEPYHSDLVSTTSDKSSDALRKIIAKKLDDGGHTIDWGLNALSSKAITNYDDLAGDEYWYSYDVYWDMRDARDAAGISSGGSVIKGYQEYTKSGCDTIAYVTFDSFDYEEDEDNWTTAEKTAKRELPSGTTSSNYMNDTFRLTMYANDMIKEHNIKNVVVDLTCNGGGTVCTEFFIASWLCGNATRGVEQKIWNPKTNSYCDFTVNADINGDNVYDSKDYLGDDVNLYVITSCNSFSCGNMLPCNIQDNRPNTTFIGSKSGGGACYVDSDILGGINSFYQISSTCHMLKLASTISSFVTVDDGCTITDGWAFDETSQVSKFFDRSLINNKIWAL